MTPFFYSRLAKIYTNDLYLDLNKVYCLCYHAPCTKTKSRIKIAHSSFTSPTSISLRHNGPWNVYNACLAFFQLSSSFLFLSWRVSLSFKNIIKSSFRWRFSLRVFFHYFFMIRLLLANEITYRGRWVDKSSIFCFSWIVYSKPWWHWWRFYSLNSSWKNFKHNKLQYPNSMSD